MPQGIFLNAGKEKVGCPLLTPTCGEPALLSFTVYHDNRSSKSQTCHLLVERRVGEGGFFVLFYILL
jgi:hypothetical protein